MTKQEKIQEAYGEYWNDKIDVNGWCKLNIKTDKKLVNYMINNKILFENKVLNNPDSYLVFFRPKSLQGIETNNGWINIESEDDLPKEEKDYWVVDSDGEVFICFFDEDYKAFKGYFHYDQNGEITHYQPIQKPQPPLY